MPNLKQNNVLLQFNALRSIICAKLNVFHWPSVTHKIQFKYSLSSKGAWLVWYGFNRVFCCLWLSPISPSFISWINSLMFKNNTFYWDRVTGHMCRFLYFKGTNEKSKEHKKLRNRDNLTLQKILIISRFIDHLEHTTCWKDGFMPVWNHINIRENKTAKKGISFGSVTEADDEELW